jgi:hypothetical protein
MEKTTETKNKRMKESLMETTAEMTMETTTSLEKWKAQSIFFSEGAIETEGSEEVTITVGPEEIDDPKEIFPEGVAEDDGFGVTVGVCGGIIDVDGVADGAEDGAPVGSATCSHDAHYFPQQSQ